MNRNVERPEAAGLMRGSGLFPHNDADDRPESLFGGINTIHTSGPHTSHIPLPRIPG